jgi:hypothetical protein
MHVAINVVDTESKCAECYLLVLRMVSFMVVAQHDPSAVPYYGGSNLRYEVLCSVRDMLEITVI